MKLSEVTINAVKNADFLDPKKIKKQILEQHGIDVSIAEIKEIQSSLIQSVCDRIRTFEDACHELGLDPKSLPDFSMIPEKHSAALVAHYKLVIIAEALNEGWEPNWNDWNECKYFPWFEVNASEENPSGSGFSLVDFVCAYAVTRVGSRLCFKTRELARYAGTQFKDLYKDYFLIMK